MEWIIGAVIVLVCAILLANWRRREILKRHLLDVQVEDLTASNRYLRKELSEREEECLRRKSVAQTLNRMREKWRRDYYQSQLRIKELIQDVDRRWAENQKLRETLTMRERELAEARDAANIAEATCAGLRWALNPDPDDRIFFSRSGFVDDTARIHWVAKLDKVFRIDTMGNWHGSSLTIGECSRAVRSGLWDEITVVPVTPEQFKTLEEACSDLTPAPKKARKPRRKSQPK